MSQLKEKLEIAYKKLDLQLENIKIKESRKKIIEFTGGPISVCDLIAYQIGWGNLLIFWYKSGIAGQTPQMPLDGFSWDYEAIAKHFFKTYKKESFQELRMLFFNTFKEISMIIDETAKNKQLDAIGVWDWCTLKSGKKWPLSKWIQVNTVAPYNRATKIIRSTFKL